MGGGRGRGWVGGELGVGWGLGIYVVMFKKTKIAIGFFWLNLTC